MLAFKQAFLETSSLRQPLSREAESTLADAVNRRNFVVDRLQRFLDSGLSFNYSKTNLSDYFSTSPADMTLESATLANDRFVGDWQQWVNKLTDVATDVRVVYENAFQLAIPPLNDSTVASLWLVAYGRKLGAYAKPDSQLMSYIQGLGTDQRKESMLNMVSELYGDYLSAMQDVQVRSPASYSQVCAIESHVKLLLRRRTRECNVRLPVTEHDLRWIVNCDCAARAMRMR